MTGFISALLLVAALAGGALYGYSYLKARRENISVVEALLKVLRLA